MLYVNLPHHKEFYKKIPLYKYIVYCTSESNVLPKLILLMTVVAELSNLVQNGILRALCWQYSQPARPPICIIFYFVISLRINGKVALYGKPCEWKIKINLVLCLLFPPKNIFSVCFLGFSENYVECRYCSGVVE